jgi:hypothetical protein
MSITGPGSDVASDLCWKLPADVRNAMTLEDKEARGCKCMGVNMLDENSCNHPGLGSFRSEVLDGPLPPEPEPLGNPPPDPVIPERPVQPQDQSDSIAMADYFAKLQVWEAEATAVQENYKREIADFQARAKLYESEKVAYETARVQLQVAVAPAEGVVRTFLNGAGLFYVNKEDRVAYFTKVGFAWFVQFSICLLLFGAILYLQKRKDVV